MGTKTVMMPKELTAENGAKGMLSGEFFEEITIECPECLSMGEQDDDMCPECFGTNKITRKAPVSWTTIKEIYAKAVKHLAQQGQGPKEVNVYGSGERTEKDVCRDLSKVHQSRDWHRLSAFEKLLVADLEGLGYLEKKAVPNGFVGRSTGA